MSDMNFADTRENWEVYINGTKGTFKHNSRPRPSVRALSILSKRMRSTINDLTHSFFAPSHIGSTFFFT